MILKESLKLSSGMAPPSNNESQKLPNRIVEVAPLNQLMGTYLPKTWEIEATKINLVNKD